MTVNLAPADLPKEGSHFDLPIAVGLLAAMGVVPGDVLQRYVVLGECRRRHGDSGVRRAPRRDRRQRPRAGAYLPRPCGRKPPGPARTWTSSPPTAWCRSSTIFAATR